MTNKPLHQMQVVKREEKEALLFKFILEEIADGRVALNSDWRVVALSMQSPVIGAMRRVVGGFDEADRLSLRILITGRDKTADLAGFESIGSISVRHGQDLRLLDAHEQLVLGLRSAWCGDCMRRNPSERDAFEAYIRDEETLSAWAAKTFERMWKNGCPITASGKRLAQEGETAAAEGFLAAGETKQDTIVAATSRH
jgi:hypothetical protein